MTDRADVEVDAVVFDVDGTLVDSAEGIVAGYRHALASVGFAAPSEEVLRSDLGPPVGDLLTRLGLAEDLLERAVAEYRRYYRQHGMSQASVDDGIPPVLDALAARVPLGTATAKLTTVATDFLATLGLSDRFAVVNGTDDLRHTKTGLRRPARPRAAPATAGPSRLTAVPGSVSGRSYCGPRHEPPPAQGRTRRPAGRRAR